MAFEDEIRHVDRSDVIGGSVLPWKVAQWGSHLDLRLIEKLKRRFPTFGQLEKGLDGYPKCIFASEGLQLRNENSGEELDELRDAIGKRKLDIKKLKRLRHIFQFTDEATSETVQEGEHFVRKGRGKLPLRVCHPPHVIVNAARTFAVYCDEALIVPPGQVGIIHVDNDIDFLKSLSLYLSSDFALYHQFFTSLHFGVKRDTASLNSLRAVPIPLLEISDSSMKDWVRVHTAIMKVRPIDVSEIRRPDERQLFVESDRRTELLGELNSLAYDALRLSERERSLVNDLIHVRLSLTDGRIGAAAVSAPEPKTMKSYAHRLVSELNSFVGDVLPKRFEAEVVYDSLSAIIALDFVKKAGRAKAPTVRNADAPESQELRKTREKLRVRFSQWIYLNRNLRIYEGSHTYILKPMQRFHWTESQAMADAAEIFSESLEIGVAE